MRHPHLIQFATVALAAGALGAAGMLQGSLQSRSQDYEITATDNSIVQAHPDAALLMALPGGLRAPLVSYLWIRAENYKNEGKVYDAMQLADLICRLEPQFPGVWAFHAWNMAWNISVTTKTPEERWLWITNGLRLLRDQGIPLNPRSLILYKETAWIFNQKIGQNVDDMHLAYKQKWASQMQHLLGSPPLVGVQEVIDAFRPIAEAPLDKDPARQGKETIQADQLAKLTADESVARYVKLLAEQGIAVDWSLLNAYNHFSREDSAEVVRLLPPKLETAKDKAISALINSKEHANVRAKLIAFVRSQILWNEYKMDPAWMLALMEKYKAPFDWRLPWPHGLYWVTYGLKVSNDIPIEKIDSINTERIAMTSLANMVYFGRLTYIENPQKGDAPMVAFNSDWRYIEATNNEYLDMIDKYSKARGEKMEYNVFQIGHTNFLIYAIQMLYANYQWDKAQFYFDWIKKNYKIEGDPWDKPLKEFVLSFLNREGLPTDQLAVSQISTSLQMAYCFLAVGDAAKFNDSFGYSRRVYQFYQNDTKFARLKLIPFENIAGDIAVQMILEPRAAGYYLPLPERSELYFRLDEQTRVISYDRLNASQLLHEQCKAEGMDFDKSFPAPSGIEQYRQQQQEQFKLNPANKNTAPGEPG